MRLHVALLLLLGTLAVGCAPGERDRTALQGDPAAALRLADAVVLRHFGGDNQITIDGPVDAWDGYAFGVQVGADDVFAFYERELTRLGWTLDPLADYQLTVESRARTWCRSLETFHLGVIKDRAFDPQFYKGQTFRTVFETTLRARPPGTPCPQR